MTRKNREARMFAPHNRIMPRGRIENRILPDERATLALGADLATLLTAETGYGGDAVVFLNGELGAGKTTLVRGILRLLGFRGAVKSPTYTLLEPYDEYSVLHFDFYRIGDSRELDFIGIDELMATPSIKLIEWPERADDRLPAPDINIVLRLDGGGRCAEIAFPPGLSPLRSKARGSDTLGQGDEKSSYHLSSPRSKAQGSDRAR